MKPHVCANCGDTFPVSIRVQDFFHVKRHMGPYIYTHSIDCLIAYNLAHPSD